MSTRVEVLLWAQRIVGRKGAAAHELLEIREDATIEQAQEAFHKVARIAHPDLHRTTLDAAELENVTMAYSYVAAAYQAFRAAKTRGVTGRIPPVDKPAVPERAADQSQRIKRLSEPVSNVVRLPGGGIVSRGGATRPPFKPTVPPDRPRASAPTTPPPPRAAAAPAPAASSDAAAPPSASTAMNSKALVYYRKAEMALRQGDLRMALLNLKMAIASDPASTLLRQALAEVELELKAK